MHLAGLKLPLKRVSHVSGDLGFGPSAPSAVPIAEGVVITRRGAISLYRHDLSEELWRVQLDGWSSSVIKLERSVVNGPVGGYLAEYDVRTGTLRRKLHFEGVAGIRAVVGEACLIRAAGRVHAVAWDGKVLWSRDALPGHVIGAGHHVLITEQFEQQLVCLDALTGALVWQFDPPKWGKGGPGDVSNTILAGFPSVCVFRERVVVVTRGGGVHALALESGEVLSSAQAPFVGPYFVTERSVFFKQAFGLSEFDHRGMREVERIEYRAQVEPLYAGNTPTVNACLVTDESVVWTTMHGTLMGVNRKPNADGYRTTWRHDVPGALMPIGEAPTTWGPYLYFTRKGAEPELQCFKSEAVTDS